MLQIHRFVPRLRPTLLGRTISARSYGDLWSDKERAEEQRFANVQDDKALRQLLDKMKGPSIVTPNVIHMGEPSTNQPIHDYVPLDTLEKLLQWEYDNH